MKQFATFMVRYHNKNDIYVSQANLTSNKRRILREFNRNTNCES